MPDGAADGPRSARRDGEPSPLRGLYYFGARPTTAADVDDWLEVFRRKEANPASIGLLEMEQALRRRFGVGSPPASLHVRYADFAEQVAAAPGRRVHLISYEDFVTDHILEPELRTLLSGPWEVGPGLGRVLRQATSGGWKAFLTASDFERRSNR